MNFIYILMIINLKIIFIEVSLIINKVGIIIFFNIYISLYPTMYSLFTLNISYYISQKFF